MAQVTACEVPEGSLLAGFGGPEDYRDCFERAVPGEVSLSEFVESFYRSIAFLPERLVLRALGTPAASADAGALARGETARFGAWKVVEQRASEVLLVSKGTGTASWFAVEPLAEGGTRLWFGSWVGRLDQSGWRFMERPHVWYSRILLGGVRL